MGRARVAGEVMSTAEGGPGDVPGGTGEEEREEDNREK